MQSNFKYYAFISYKSEDEPWARWLQDKLENYRLPTALCRKNADLPKRIKPCFRYHTDIQPDELKVELANKLEQSKYLIVICSPKSAKSPWVGEEIETFIRLERRNRIIPFIVDGIPYSGNAETECFHPVLQKYFPHSENIAEDRQILGVNINEEGIGNCWTKRQRAVIMVVSKLLDVSFDELWKRQKRRLVRQAASWMILILIVLLAMGFVWKANQPFDVEVRVKEVPYINRNLHFPANGGTMYYIYNGSDTLKKNISSFDEIVVFKDIPGRFLNEKTRLLFSMYGFHDIDTVFPAARNLVLPIRRDGTYGKIWGFVKERNSNNLVENASIKILDYEVFSDFNGRFEMYIPIEKQQEVYHLEAEKEGVGTEKKIVYPNSEITIRLEHVK